MRRAFARIGGEGQAPIGFQFTVGEWSCIGLDSHIPGEVAGQIQDVQLELLRHQLSECSSARVALFLHHPPVNVNSEWMDAIGLKNKDALQDIVRGDNRIRLICCGHVHHEFEGSIDQATVLATPSTGLQFDPIGSSPTFCNDPPGYRIIEFNDVDFTTTVVRVPVDG